MKENGANKNGDVRECRLMRARASVERWRMVTDEAIETWINRSYSGDGRMLEHNTTDGTIWIMIHPPSSTLTYCLDISFPIITQTAKLLLRPGSTHAMTGSHPGPRARHQLTVIQSENLDILQSHVCMGAFVPHLIIILSGTLGLSYFCPRHHDEAS